MSIGEAVDPNHQPAATPPPDTRKRTHRKKGSSNKYRRINGPASPSLSSPFMGIAMTHDREGRVLPLNSVDSVRLKEEIKMWAKAVVSYANRRCGACSKD